MDAAAVAALAELVAAPRTSLVVTDYDGTLAPIVSDPAAAVPHPRAVELLARLATTYRKVLVVSGRPADFLAAQVRGPVGLVGLYGLEGIDVGERWEHPNGGAWREVMADVAARAAAQGPEGMRVELKVLSLTLHYREHPELEAAVRAFAERAAARAGLACRAARMSVELHPPIDVDKGTVVEGAADGATGVVFIGDDRGDLAAFDALDRLAERGVHAVRVAVRSPEAPEELLARADVVVDGTDAVIDLLAYLADGADAAS